MIWCSTVLCLILLQSSVCECQNIQSEKSDNNRRAREVQGGYNLAFTQESYNVVIPENSLGQAHDMFSRIFRLRIYDFFLSNIM